MSIENRDIELDKPLLGSRKKTGYDSLSTSPSLSDDPKLVIAKQKLADLADCYLDRQGCSFFGTGKNRALKFKRSVSQCDSLSALAEELSYFIRHGQVQGEKSRTSSGFTSLSLRGTLIDLFYPNTIAAYHKTGAWLHNVMAQQFSDSVHRSDDATAKHILRFFENDCQVNLRITKGHI